MDMAQTLLSTVGSLAATMMLFRSLLPPDLQYYISSFIYILFRRFSTQLTMVIDEFIGSSRDEIYEAAKIYLGSKTSSTTRRVRVSKSQKENIELAMERHEEVVEYYNGVKFKWVWVCVKKENTGKYANASARASYEIRSFELTFQKKQKDMVVKSYLPFVLKQAQIIKDAKKTLKIFTLDPDCIYPNSPYCWHSVRLNHPATFDTLAMDTNVKEMVMKDLERFVKRKEKYRKIGKAWKRGYLLYGPPGTGKSSLIAAMANYLSFNIYDLELTDITRNSKLRHALMGTTNRSILVVEDIDCTIELQERVSAGAKASKSNNSNKDKEESKVTLSGFLNFIDGLWSSIGDERIIIFTTNHKEKLDPALLRPGRMDLHVHMSYCTPCGFELLAANYLGIDYHERFGEIEELIRTTEVTPAEVAEQLLKNDNPDISLRGLIDFLHAKGKENEKAKAKQVAEAAAAAAAAAAEATAVGKEKEKKEEEKENEEEDEKKKEKETENAGIKV